MYRKLVIGYLDHERGSEALTLARRLADNRTAELVACHVTPVHGYFEDLELIAERDAEQKRELERALAELAPGFEGSVRMLVGPSPAGTLYNLAEAEGADLIVLGSTHRGPVGRILMGATVESLLHGAPCAVAVAPHGYRPGEGGIRTIGVAYDGGAQADTALAAAVELARGRGARLRLIAVVRPPSEYVPPVAGAPLRLHPSPALLDRARAQVQHTLDSALDQLPDGVAREGVVLVGTPEDAIRDEVRKGCDLLVIGSRGYGAVMSVLLGSTSRKLVRDCSVPVLVTPIAEAPV